MPIPRAPANANTHCAVLRGARTSACAARLHPTARRASRAAGPRAPGCSRGDDTSRRPRPRRPFRAGTRLAKRLRDPLSLSTETDTWTVDDGRSVLSASHSRRPHGTITKSAPLVALMAVLIFAPTAAQAQDERLRVSFAPAVATVSGTAELALGGSFGYRFSERFWFEGELTWIDAATSGFGGIFDLDARTIDSFRVVDFVQGRVGGIGIPVRPGIPGLPTFPISIGPIRATTDGSTTIGTLGVRYELPHRSSASVPTWQSDSASTTRISGSGSSGPYLRPHSTSLRRTPVAPSARAGARACAWRVSSGPTSTRNTSACRATATSCGWAAA
jgi:hypothetical protein